MAKYKWEITIRYEFEADTEEEAMSTVASFVDNDWSEYANDGELTKIENS